jgi:hypothetical protein
MKFAKAREKIEQALECKKSLAGVKRNLDHW